MSYYFSNTRRKVKCVVCGKYFVTNHPSKKTCSITCSMERKQIATKELNENNKRYYKNARKSK